MVVRRLLLSAALALACSAPAMANDGIGSVSAGGIIVGKTDVGRTTICVLNMNTEDQVERRRQSRS